MKKIYFLSTCDTCKRIMKDLGVDDSWVQREIKSQSISSEELEELRTLAGSYESLFSRRSRQFKARGLGDRHLTESDYKDLILDEYTFLKRPVLLIDGKIFIGNSKSTVEEAKRLLSEKL